MAPAKRSAAAAPKGRAAKVPKVDPAVERVRCVFDLLQDYAPHLSEPEAEMLRGVIPHALALPAAERHAYQADMVKSVQSIADEAVQVAANMVQDAEADIASHVAEMNASEEVLGKAKAEEETKMASKIAAAEALTAAQDAGFAAQAETKSAKFAVDEAEKAGKTAVDAKAVFEEAFTTTWRSLADGTFEGKDWRKRNKAITSMVKLLEEAEAPESLRETMGVALKDKPETRGAFAIKAMEFGEAHMKARLEALGADIQSAETKVTEAKSGLQETTTKEEAAAKEALVALDVSVAANKEWTEADKAVKEINKQIKGFGKRTRELDSVLNSQKASSERLRELIVSFEALRDAVAETPEVPDVNVAAPTEAAAKVLPEEANTSNENAAISGA